MLDCEVIIGTPTPPPPIIGVNCALCDGTLWDAGETPEFIHVTFAGVVKCPGAASDPPDGTFVLKQNLGTPCLWEYDDATYEIKVLLRDIDSRCGVAVMAWNYFLGIEPPCSSVFTNTRVVCGVPPTAKNGTASIIWS